MKWSEARDIAAALVDDIPGTVQAKVVILIDVPGTSYNERGAILRALERELTKRGAVVHFLNGRRRLDKLTNQTNQTDPERGAERKA